MTFELHQRTRLIGPATGRHRIPWFGVALACVAQIVPIAFGQTEATGTGSVTGTQAAPPLPPVAGAFDVERLKSQLKAVEAATDLDAAVRSKAMAFYQQAIEFTERTSQSALEADQCAAAIKAAPQHLDEIKKSLAQPVEAAAPGTHEAADLTTEQIELRVRKQGTDLNGARAQLADRDARLARKRERPNVLGGLINESQQRLEKVDSELKAAAPAKEQPTLTEARRAALRARKQMRQTELTAYEQEMVGHDISLSLIVAERDRAARQVAQHEMLTKSWQAAAQNRRHKVARQTLKEAEQAQQKTLGLPAAVQQVAEKNVHLGKELEVLAAREAQLGLDVQRAESQLKKLQQNFASARKRVDAVGLTEATGLLLRNQRQSLAAHGRLRTTAGTRRAPISSAASFQIDIEEQHIALATVEPAVKQVLHALKPSELSDAVTGEVRKLLTDQRDLLEKLNQGYERYLGRMIDLDTTEHQLVAMVDEFASFIDEHALWIRSAPPLNLSDAPKAWAALKWLVRPRSWAQAVNDVGWTMWSTPLTWIVGIAAIITLLASRRHLQARVESLAELVGSVRTDSCVHTLSCLGMTAALAAGWPLVIGLVG